MPDDDAVGTGAERLWPASDEVGEDIREPDQTRFGGQPRGDELDRGSEQATDTVLYAAGHRVFGEAGGHSDLVRDTSGVAWAGTGGAYDAALSEDSRAPRQSSRLAQLLVVVLIAVGVGAASGAAAAAITLQRANNQAGAGPRSAPARLGAMSADGDLDPMLAVVRATRPAVVTIWNVQYGRRTMMSPVRLEPVGSGSGVIFDERGLIATNHHVIDNARAIEVVFLDGRRAPATVVGSDSRFDVAILALAEGTDIPAVAPLADSSKVEPGMRVVAIGSPLGIEYQNTVTAGIIAGLNRNIKRRAFDPFSWRTFEQEINATPLLQTDAPINQGNSGGPLVSLDGEVVGLNTAVLRQDRRAGGDIESFGFAVPSNVVRALADEWIDGAARASLGVGFSQLDPELARTLDIERGSGAIVEEVRPGSAGARAGLQRGDLIVAIDDVVLDPDHALADVLWRYRAGDRARLTVERGDDDLELTVTFEAWQAPR